MKISRTDLTHAPTLVTQEEEFFSELKIQEAPAKEKW